MTESEKIFAKAAPKGEKLQKVLARTGLGSRREIERWISAGRVKVNDSLAALGDRVSSCDCISVDGKPVNFVAASDMERRVLIYNKPEGEIVTRNDPEGRPTVFDCLPRLHGERWIAIGRLDINTAGLLLFTTDGELANALMHPSVSIEREYAVRVMGQVNMDMVTAMHEGVLLEDGMSNFTDIQEFGGEGINRWFHVVIMQGRNREVRRLWESQGLRVSRLKRVRFGYVFLPPQLRAGMWMEIPQSEVNALSSSVGLKAKKISQRAPERQQRFERQQQRQKTRRRVS
jgi:23S rRNA pseudouridine2605 synthase